MVRATPEIHSRAAIAVARIGLSLNKYIAKAIEDENRQFFETCLVNKIHQASRHCSRRSEDWRLFITLRYSTIENVDIAIWAKC